MMIAPRSVSKTTWPPAMKKAIRTNASPIASIVWTTIASLWIRHAHIRENMELHRGSLQLDGDAGQRPGTDGCLHWLPSIGSLAFTFWYESKTGFDCGHYLVCPLIAATAFSDLVSRPATLFRRIDLQNLHRCTRRVCMKNDLSIIIP